MDKLAALLKKETLIEIRKKFSLQGVLLYTASTVFISYLSFREFIDPATWNALLWIIIMFASINAIAKSFIAESTDRFYYYYYMIDSHLIIISKMIYNLLLVWVIGLLTLLLYLLFLHNPVADTFDFIVAFLLGCAGFAFIFTMISAIAARASGGAGLMAILSFPVVIPLIITLIKYSGSTLEGSVADDTPFALILLALDVMVVALAYLLFPYIWRE